MIVDKTEEWPGKEFNDVSLWKSFVIFVTK